MLSEGKTSNLCRDNESCQFFRVANRSVHSNEVPVHNYKAAEVLQWIVLTNCPVEADSQFTLININKFVTGNIWKSECFSRNREGL